MSDRPANIARYTALLEDYYEISRAVAELEVENNLSNTATKEMNEELRNQLREMDERFAELHEEFGEPEFACLMEQLSE